MFGVCESASGKGGGPETNLRSSEGGASRLQNESEPNMLTLGLLFAYSHWHFHGKRTWPDQVQYKKFSHNKHLQA